jgi:nucleoside-diphosphate-sugar epimerase
MRILITGSSGQLGQALSQILSKYHDVIGLDLAPGPYTTHRGDITDEETVSAVAKGVDVIFHLAALHARHLEGHGRSDFVATNIQGTLNLLGAAVANGARRFIFASTTSVYGHAVDAVGKAVWVTEDLNPVPRDIYDITKLAAEDLCQLVAREEGLSCVTLRFARFFPEPIMQTAIHRLNRGVSLSDVVAASIQAMKAELSGYDVFNISARSPFAPHECEELLYNAPRVIRRHFPSVPALFKDLGCDLPESIGRVYVSEKAERILGFTPRHNFGDMLAEIFSAPTLTAAR